jgi:hypothetical protein
MPTLSAREPIYRVDEEHQPFLTTLMQLGLRVGGVKEIGGRGRIYLAMRALDAAEALKQLRTLARAFDRAPPGFISSLRLGRWKLRRIDERWAIYWTGIELRLVMLH